MITERDIAEKFTIIWKQHFPLLTSNFMRVFNEAQIEDINKYVIPLTDGIRYDLVSEFAFKLSSEIYNSEINPDDYLKKNNNEERISKETANIIWKNKYTLEELELTKDERSEIFKIYNNISEFINVMNESEVEFRPKIKGYGVIPDLEADLSISDTLYEIKTVNRNFKSSDLKQLFIYLALQQVSGNGRWKYGGLYNPRRGTFCKFNIRSLVYNLSGGNSCNEAFENFLNSLSRDVQIDSKF